MRQNAQRCLDLPAPRESVQRRSRVGVVTGDADVLAVFRHAFDCARGGDALWLRSFVDAGGSADLTNDKGDTLLILAAYHVRLEAVKALLTLGVEVDRVNDNGQTALAAAVFRRSAPIVAMLLDAGADPSAGARSAHSIADFFELEDMAALLTQPRQ
ncbi:ankyrin repeat domain-containing protein [Rhodococcus sp. G-MC3]|uniref:ankyrin repeat domain-containing protein n=1 Tax=Rhodococcus sp. G-MC3 TaxID=3046209 RepID=UPI0024BBA6F9|nr:ankyrin repeat domain-containing protein [Rhodococcus sp. G-MC3]MDJ0396461.1 ankyrin repeat domain-containing protein [Rhodococcus sp. G-MC3]